MFQSLELTNFKGIKEGKIEFEPLTILLGPNNSGKTTILEALFFAPNPFRQVTYSYRGYGLSLNVIHNLHKTLESEGYSFLFFDYFSDSAKIVVETKNELKHALDFLKDRHEIIVLSNLSRKSRSREYKGKPFPAIGVISSFEDRISHIYDSDIIIDNSILISSSLRDAAFEYLKTNWAYVMNMRIGNKVALEASKLSYDKYNDITIEPFLGNKLSINAYFKSGKRIRLGDLGEGMQNFVIAKFLFEIEKPKILLWDDVESHMNPRMILNVGSWIYDLLEQNKQVILTSHSLEAARAIANLNKEHVGIYLTLIEDNILKTKKISLDDLENYVNAGIDIRVAERFLI